MASIKSTGGLKHSQYDMVVFMYNISPIFQKHALEFCDMVFINPDILTTILVSHEKPQQNRERGCPWAPPVNLHNSLQPSLRLPQPPQPPGLTTENVILGS